MTRQFTTCGVALMPWLGASAALLAQSGALTYDRTEEVTVSGTILHVVSLAAPDGAVAVHLDFKTSDGMLNVHVAPAMFIGQENFWFFADDRLDVVGVKTFIDGNNAFIVRSLKKDGKTLTLRDSDGKPAWKAATEGVDGCGVAHAPLPRGTEL